jgi:rod shape-determining protein MreC
VALGDRTGSRVDTALFLACLLLSLVALALPEALRAPVAGALRRTVLSPTLAVQRRTVRSAEFRTDVEMLRAERDSLVLRAADAPALASENARLRGLLGLAARLVHGFTPAEVLHQAGVSDGLTLVLSAGSRQGVSRLAPVVAPEGLVGTVLAVDPSTSVAMAWTHPDFRVSATADEGRVHGIVAARRGSVVGEAMELRGVAYRDQLEPGTLVVTSGMGGVFPRGIPIGTVQGVLDESGEWERTYLLRPAVHPADVVHVMVLSRSRARDTLAVFVPDPAADSSRAAAEPRQPTP